MKRLLFFLMITLAAGSVTAQPKKSRTQQGTIPTQQKQQQQNNTQGMTERMRIMYPTALDMPEDVVWRRDIYREINLEDEMNSGLYYPVEPIGKQMNLFTYIFKLALNGYIPVYEYNLDGNEVLEASAKVDIKTILDNYHIFYEEKNGKIQVENSDIPSSEVKAYYLKESAYYDQANSSFHVKVLALCPVMLRDDDFGGEATQYPLFWVKYADLEPYLTRQTVMASSLNNAATMSLDDYFTLNMYRGTIYKTNNAQGKTLMQLCEGDTTKLSAEQKRIEKELEAFRKNIFGDPEKKDSLDSIAKLDVKATKKTKTKSASTSSGSRRTKAGKSKSGSSNSSPSNSSARVSVRRQRH